MKGLNLAIISLLLPLSLSPVIGAAAEEPSTAILIMVDGARPDIIEELSSEGQIPNISHYFIKQGTTVANSFTSLSLTVPSWSSILSGMDIHHTSIKGNDVFNRKTKDISNYLDWRQDIVFGENRQHGRAFRDLHSAKNYLLTDFFNSKNMTQVGTDNEVFMTFFPVNDHFPMRLLETIPPYLVNGDLWGLLGLQSSFVRLLFHYSGYEAVDRDSVDSAIEVIRDISSPKKRLIGVYFSSVDHLTHLDAGLSEKAITFVDYEIGRLMQAVGRSRYRNSTIVLVSDHGSLGGYEPNTALPSLPLRGQTYTLTQTNLSYFFTGWYNKPSYSDYNFNVEVALAAEGKYSYRNMSEIQMQPFQCTNLARGLTNSLFSCLNTHEKEPDKITAAVSSTESISLPYASRLSGDWLTPNTWYTLTHFEIGDVKNGKSLQKNILKDLENFKIDNLALFDREQEKVIGHQPLDWLAIEISANDFNHSASAKTFGLSSDENIIFVHQSDLSQAVILQKRPSANSTNESNLFRYQPISNFSQDASGEVHFELQAGVNPFGYSLSQIGYTEFHTDRQWADLCKALPYPNAVFALPRTFQFSGGAESARLSQRVDIIVNPKYGHFFSISNETDQASHGMWQNQSVHHLFMLRGPQIKRGYRVEQATLATDVVPTVLRALNQAPQILGKTQALDGRPVDDAFTNEVFMEDFNNFIPFP